MKRRLLMAVATVVLACWAGAAAAIEATDDPETSPEWQQVRVGLFGTRPIAAAPADMLVLEAPVRAEDAATVPIAIRSRFDQTATRHVKTAYLIIDRNPSPVAAIFHFTPESGRADLETRVRVEQYTFVRAIAELNDGSLHMTTRFVKASGGCSAPAGKDPAAAAAELGKMKLSVEQGATSGGTRQALLMIRHPNTSGLAMDQITRQYPRPHFVREIVVSYRDKPVLTAQVDFSISENPNFRFYFKPEGEGELKARIVDTEDQTFETRLVLGAGAL